MSTLNVVNRQWSSRPADQRFVSLLDLDSHVTSVRRNSAAKVLPNRALMARPAADDIERGLLIEGPNGAPVGVSHFAFSQLAQRAGAPAGYLRDLPAPLAADCINYGLRHARDVEELGILLTRPDANAPAVLRAATGPNYGRIWNQTITGALVRCFGDGVSGHFRVPGEFGEHVPVTKENTTLYASDRDMFVFLADEERRIEMPNRRDGKTGALARGFYISNSETGAGSLVLGTVLFDYVCRNRIIWGVADHKEIRLRHTSGAPDRWIEEAAPTLEAYAQSSTDGMMRTITAAREARIPDVDKFLRERFNGKQVEAIKAAHIADEQRPIETLWDAATGVTAYARGIQWQDERVDLERAGGRILDLAA